MTRGNLFVFLVFAGLFAVAVRPAVDPDLGWHLRTGALIASTHHVPHVDPFSFTKAGQPWIAHEWLSELAMYELWRIGGVSALILFFALVVVRTFGFMYARCDAQPYAAGMLTLVFAIVTVPAWGVRPQMFTLLLASKFLWVLDRYLATRNPRWLWWLPALMVLWVNSHGGFAMGIALVLLYAVGELAPSSTDWATRKRSAAQLVLCSLACAAVVIANPNGWRMYTYPFQTLSAPALTGYIQEWASPDFHRPIYRVLLLLIVGTLLFLSRAPRRLEGREALLLLATLAAGLVSARHIPFFILVAVPIISRRMPATLSVETRNGLRRAVHIVVAAGLVAVVALHAHNVVREQDRAEARAFPAAAVEYIRANHLGGPIYNDYDWGGFMIAHLYPEYRVFVDGRSDLYGDAFLDVTVRTYEALPGWAADFARYGIRTVLVERGAPIATVLRESREWRTAYEDGTAVVLTRQE